MRNGLGYPLMSINRIETALNLAMREEGWSSIPYYCTEKYPTIGWGFKIGNKNEPLPKITMTHTEGDKKLRDLIVNLDHTLTNDHRFSPAYENCNEDRKACMIAIAYQLGVESFSHFTPTLSLIEKSNWQGVSDHLLATKAHKQTPKRWDRLAKYFLTGDVKGA